MALKPLKPAFQHATGPGVLGRVLAGQRTQRWLLAGLAALLLALVLDSVQWQGLRHLNAAIVAAGTSTAATRTAASNTAASNTAAASATPAGAVPASAAPASAAVASNSSASAAGAKPLTDDSSAPALRFAQAHALAAQGQGDAALRGYAPLLADPLLGQSARFNTANVLLRQGQALQTGPQAGQALALIELAKEHYRSLLRNNPAFWPARYNLERAQRLVADADGLDQPPGPPAPPAERSATTMRAYAPGLP